jgi:Rieske Fe-S protein
VTDLEPSRDHPHVPGPSLWPFGLALGLVVLLVGFLLSWWIVALGAVLVLTFALLWVRELAAEKGLAHAPAVEPERRVAARELEPPPEPEPPAHEPASYARAKFLELSTLGLGAVIGGLVSVPALGFMVLPAFLDQGVEDHDLGPLEDFPEGQWLVATFTAKEDEGAVSRLTAFVRYNGLLEQQPSFTILSNHCVHLGCPVQPNGPLDEEKKKTVKDVTLIPTQPSGFGCPCHGGQYNDEGNRSSGPPVRALDRYSFSIRNGRLFVGEAFSVSHVEGSGASAKIHKWRFAFPGIHVDGIESWLYPIQPPH